MAVEVHYAVRVDGPTPAGGDYMETFFMDADHRLSDREHARYAEVVEYDITGAVIMRTYLTLGSGPGTMFGGDGEG